MLLCAGDANTRVALACFRAFANMLLLATDINIACHVRFWSTGGVAPAVPVISAVTSLTRLADGRLYLDTGLKTMDKNNLKERKADHVERKT